MFYSLQDIKKAYGEYESQRAFSTLQKGKWTHKPLGGGTIPDVNGVTSAKIRPLKEVMKFTEYLENHYQKE